MSDSAERVRRHRARKAREEEALAEARANALPPPDYLWDEKANTYRATTADEKARMHADTVARAERYALWRLRAYERGECASG